MALIQCSTAEDDPGRLDLLRSFATSELARMLAVLLPPAEVGLAGPHTRKLLSLIGQVLVEREHAA